MRPDWDTYFMRMAELAATRSTCLRRQVGAVLVKDNQVLATGYNGAPRGQFHCSQTDCLREKLHVPSGERHELCRALHAEQNALIQAAVHGVAIKGATIYITHQPCSVCAKMLVNAYVERIVFKGDYPDKLALEFLQAADIQLDVYKGLKEE